MVFEQEEFSLSRLKISLCSWVGQVGCSDSPFIRKSVFLTEVLFEGLLVFPFPYYY